MRAKIKKNRIFAVCILLGKVYKKYHKLTYLINFIIHQKSKKMKKIFTLTLVLLAMVFAGNAQSLFSENFENGIIPTGWVTIDADNDTYTWEGSANPVSYFQPGTDLSGTGHNSSNGFVLSGSYSNVNGVLTPDNWLITPAINLTANANLTFWVCAQDASYAAEHYGVYISTTAGTTPADFTLLFEETIDANGGSRQGAWKQKTANLSSYTGQTVRIAFRHFNCTDEFILNLDDVEIFAQPTDPTIVAQPSTINFGTLISGTTQTQTVNVVTYNLTAGVTATTAAPFAVSADGTTFGTTATVASTGGTLYVQYAPTAVATDNGTVTLSSTGATDVTITLAGEAIDCNASIPYSFAFDNDALAQCWTVIDANNDGKTFNINTENGYSIYQYHSTNAADDWLISPVFTLTGAQLASIDYRAGSTTYPERFQVFAIGADTVALTQPIDVTSNTFQTLYIDLSSLTGNYQIAFHCISDADELYLYLTNFNINLAGLASLTVDLEDIDFGTIEMNTVSDVAEVEITTISVTDPITLSVAAPFEVSLDSVTFGATATIPASVATVSVYNAYVRFAPTAVGTFAQNLTITAGTLSDTVALTGGAVDCSVGIASLPYTFGFDDPIAPPLCWTAENPENYSPGTIAEDDNACVFLDADVLVTPEIHATSAMLMSLDYVAYFGSEAEEFATFRIGYSSTDNNVSSFTWQGDITANQDVVTTLNTVIPAGTKYIAIEVTNIGYGLYYGMFEIEDYLFIDNFTLTALDNPMMIVSTEDIYFGSVMVGANAVREVSVTGALLTNNITVSAPAQFEVSTNGTSYASTATLPANGGNLYVRYNPTAAGNHSGNITLTSGSTTKTITVAGSAIDCSAAQALPYFDGFEDGIGACYRNIDNDGDGYTWYDNIYSEWPYEPYEGNGCAMSASYINDVGALYPDNWLITPALAIPAQGAKVSWYVAAQDGNYPAEYYEVLVSSTPDNLNSYATIFNETLETSEWEQRTANIPSSFNGQTAYVAFRHYDVTDMFWMKIDNLSVTPGTGVENHEVNTTIYPNPANNVLNINASCNINRVEVYNMMGQLVSTFDANDMNVQINTTHFANGVYTLKIDTENGTSTQKFTVAR